MVVLDTGHDSAGSFYDVRGRVGLDGTVQILQILSCEWLTLQGK